MNTQQTLLGTLAGALGLFVSGYLIYVVLFHESMPLFSDGDGAASVARDAVDFPLIILMEVIFGFLLTYIFGRWAGIKTVAGGAKAGALLGLLIGLATGLLIHAQSTLTSLSGVAFGAVTYAIRFGIAGALVGWVLGRDD